MLEKYLELEKGSSVDGTQDVSSYGNDDPLSIESSEISATEPDQPVAQEQGHISIADEAAAQPSWLDYINGLPGGSAKIMAVRWLILSLSGSYFDMTFSVFKASWLYQPMDTAWPRAADMMLSSMTGAAIWVSLAQLSGECNRHQMESGEVTFLLHVISQVINNATGAGVRFLVNKALGEQTLVHPGEATYGVLLGEILSCILLMAILFAVMAVFVTLETSARGLARLWASPEPQPAQALLMPPVSLTAIALQTVGFRSLIGESMPGVTGAANDQVTTNTDISLVELVETGRAGRLV